MTSASGRRAYTGRAGSPGARGDAAREGGGPDAVGRRAGAEAPEPGRLEVRPARLDPLAPEPDLLAEARQEAGELGRRERRRADQLLQPPVGRAAVGGGEELAAAGVEEGGHDGPLRGDLGDAEGEGLQRRRAGHGDPERLAEAERGRDADAQPREAPRAHAHHDGVDLAHGRARRRQQPVGRLEHAPPRPGLGAEPQLRDRPVIPYEGQARARGGGVEREGRQSGGPARSGYRARGRRRVPASGRRPCGAVPAPARASGRTARRASGHSTRPIASSSAVLRSSASSGVGGAQAVGVDVRDRDVALIALGDGEGGAGDGARHPAGPGHRAHEGRLARSELAAQQHEVARREQRREPGAERLRCRRAPRSPR